MDKNSPNSSEIEVVISKPDIKSKAYAIPIKISHPLVQISKIETSSLISILKDIKKATDLKP